MSKQLISRIFDFYVTTKCTLNCDLCMTAVPHIAEHHRQHFPIETLARQMKEFFSVYDFAERFELMGGEPLMHPNVVQIVREAFNYRDQFKDFRITTNATIVPSDELLEFATKCGKFFDFLVDDYGEFSPKLDEIVKKLDYYKLPYRVDKYHGDNQRFKGWVKCGDYEFINYTEEQIKEIYFDCVEVAGRFAIVCDGKVFSCPYENTFWLRYDKLPPKTEYIDLFSDELTRDEKREIAFNFYTKPLTTCSYCYGFSEQKSVRYPAAVQLPREQKI